jgi:hypothetical protein
MSFQKFANVEEILEIKSSKQRLAKAYRGDGFSKFAALEDNIVDDDGYLYVRCRAISSRVNKNNDGWPSEELAKAYSTFLHRPIFVDHNNDNPMRTRGIIVDSKLNVEDDEKVSALDSYYSSAPDNHKPPTSIELLLEVDAKTFPVLAQQIREGKIDSVSMGANIEKSLCSVCANEASNPAEYCNHIKQKGLTFEITSDKGERVKKKAYEDCLGVNFFEISFVFDPADETALISEKVGKTSSKVAVDASDFIEPVDTEQDDKNYIPQADMVTAPEHVDTLRDEKRCPVCHADDLESGADGIESCPTCGFVQPPEPINNPDLETARDTDFRQENQVTDNQDGDKEVPEEDPLKGVKDVHPVEPITISSGISAGVIDEMKWQTKLETQSKSVVDQIFPVKSATEQTKIGFRGGVHFGTHLAFRNEGLSATVTYPDVPGDNTTTLPDNPMKDFKLMLQAMKIGGYTDPSQVPIIVNSDNLPEAVDLIHSGGRMGGPPPKPTLQDQPEGPTAKAAAVTPNKKAVLTTKTKASDEPKNENVISDQLKPVESSTKKSDTALIDGVEYKLIPVEDEEEKEEVDSPENEKDEEMANEKKEADRRRIKRTENPDGSRTEEIVEETGELAFDSPTDEAEVEEPEVESEETEEPESEEVAPEAESDREPAYANSANSERRIFAVFALADEAIEMGVVNPKDKFSFVSEIENETEEELNARKRMLSAVKEAGLSKKQPKTAGFGRIPRLSSSVVSSNGNGSVDDIPDEAIFWNGN